ncbi:hypothetical protein M0805_003853 [Coniferiporia weirii]|nr:hypothetical protein M0805_003853 [Coniferiporia weirii]
MTEPVLQGYAVQGQTRFLVTVACPPASISPATLPVEENSFLSAADDGEFTIGENFFASTTLRDTAWTSSMPSALLTRSGQDRSPPSLPSDADDHDNVLTSPAFSPKPLPYCPLHTVNESYTMLVRTDDLGKIGVFNGDWVLVSSREGDSRLAQVYAIEDASSPIDMVYASPALIQNCSPGPLNASVLFIHASPFGAGPPTVPTAKSMTLARVVSPLSLDRAYQNALFRSVKLYFETARRLVKKGDIISVPLGRDYASSSEASADLDASCDIDDESSGMTTDNKWQNGVGYFKITNLVYDVVDVCNGDQKIDAFSGTTFGELGCWIDSSMTRVIQTGLEHSFAPDTPDYCPISQSVHTSSNNQRRTDNNVGVEEDYKAQNQVDQVSSSVPFSKLYGLVSAVLKENVTTFGLDLSVLLKGPTRSSMALAAQLVSRRLGFHLLEASVYDIVGETEAKTEAQLREQFNLAKSCSPCILLLQDIDALAQTTQVDPGKESMLIPLFRECTNELDMNWKHTGYPVVVIATTSNAEHLPGSLFSVFKHEITFEVPSESERCGILKSMLNGEDFASDVSVKNMAVQTAALTDSDLTDFIFQAHLCEVDRIMKAVTRMNYDGVSTIRAGLTLTSDDITLALQKAHSSFSQSVGAPSIPSVSWDDVGGLAAIKKDILDTIQLPLENPALFTDGLKQRSGILLYGPPGTGKTLLAKAVATSCSLNFFSVKGPELLNMYIGESEANVRRVFQRAREAKPCVIFFDELDSVAPKRGNQGDSGGVMDRIVSQLLAELDGMASTESGSGVFVIGATNRPDLLDSALLRPGRFDRLLYLGVSDTHEAQLAIIEALTRKFRLDPQLNLMLVAEQCPFNYTGADFYALCSDAILKAMARKAQEIEYTVERMNHQPRLPTHQYPITPQYYLSELASSSETDVIVSQDDFMEALAELVPSVSQSEMEHYALIQRKFTRGSEGSAGR